MTIKEQMAANDAEQARADYASHRFITRMTVGTASDPSERYRVCTDCGCEDQGDPAEFEWLAYPNCNDVRRNKRRQTAHSSPGAGFEAGR
jgi:hypothetical protein